MVRPPARVVVVYDFGCVNGGAAQVAISSALELRRRGLAVDYFCAVGPVDPRLQASGASVTCLGQSDILSDPSRVRAAAAGVWNPSAAAALAKVLSHADRAETVVHVHGWTKALSASVFRVAQRMGFRVIVTLHEYFTACPTGGFFDHRAGQACPRRAMSASCVAANCDARSYAHKLWRVARQGVAAAMTDVHGGLADVIYISEFSRSLLAPYFAEETRWHFVRNPVDAQRCERVTAEENRSFLFIGRLSAEKGCALFCAAAADAGVPAVVVGDGPERAALERRSPDVRMAGWLDACGVQAELQSARALVLPSLWYETQGLVVQEALACGVPVIVADRTAARDAVVEGRNGVTFSQGSQGSLALAMRSFDDDASVRRMSEFAFGEYWRDPPTLEAHVDALLLAYATAQAAVEA